MNFRHLYDTIKNLECTSDTATERIISVVESFYVLHAYKTKSELPPANSGAESYTLSSLAQIEAIIWQQNRMQKSSHSALK